MAETFDLLLDNIVVPDFRRSEPEPDKSKMNFRLFFDFIYLDNNNAPKSGVLILPGGDKFWQWEDPTDRNGIAIKSENATNKTVELDITGKFESDQRRIVIAQGKLYEVSVKMVDMPDGFDRVFSQLVMDVIKRAFEEAGKQPERIGGALGFLFPGAEAIGSLSKLILDRFQLSDKIMFRKAKTRPPMNTGFSLDGKGTWKRTGDQKGDYSIKLDCSVIS